MVTRDNTPVPVPAAAPAPTRVGQTTAVEQSRAVAEVQAAVVVAQQCPRNMQTAIAEMNQACQQKSLAERAFYRYSRAGSQITGASVHLARELARCWGNVQYNIGELRRDEAAGESEMIAWAWDVQTNTRSSLTFIVPHRRDTKDGVKPLIDLRDVYENNTNMGARRLREVIFSILPAWFVEDAKTLCSETLKKGDGIPLPKRIANMISRFNAEGVTVDQMESKLGRPTGKWTDHDTAQLAVVYRSLQRGEVTVDDEFPQPRVTADEILTAAGQPPTMPPADTISTPDDLGEPDWPDTAQPPDAR